MMGLGWQELLILLVIVMIIFGAGKLTQVGTALGRSVKEFKTETDGDSAIAADTLGEDEGRASNAREIRAEAI